MYTSLLIYLIVFYFVSIATILPVEAFAVENSTTLPTVGPSSNVISTTMVTATTTTGLYFKHTSNLGSSIKATSTLTAFASSSTLSPTTNGRGSAQTTSKLYIIIAVAVVVIIVFVIICLFSWKRRPRSTRRKASCRSDIELQCGAGRRRTVMRQEHFVEDATQDDHIHCSLHDVHHPSSHVNFGTNEDDSLDSQKKGILQKPSNKVKKLIKAADGGILEAEYATVQIWPGCLSKDTEITMIKDDSYFALKELCDMGILNDVPLVLEFLPDGLTFLNSGADMTVRLPRDDPSLELFVLHGSYDSEKERTIWQLVNDELEVKKNEGTVYMQIHGFCFYSYILSRRGKVARILSHLNRSFSCYAVGLYRRIPSFPNFHVAIVLLSEFIERKPKDDDALSKMTSATARYPYQLGDKGTIKRIDTHRPLLICLEFPEKNEKKIELSVRVSNKDLDSTGMVIDNFSETINEKHPASGKICIYERHRNKQKLIWTLFINELKPIQPETPQIELTSEDQSDQEYSTAVTMRGQKLTSSLVGRISRRVGVDWDSLAGLLDIPYDEREKIRYDNTNYKDITSKANRVIEIFNESGNFCRKVFVKFLHEIGRDDVVQEIYSKKDATQEEDDEKEDEFQDNEEPTVVMRDTTPLSAREMSRISRLYVDWESLSGLMNISQATRQDIKFNALYPDGKSKMEKILDIFNKRTDFCRRNLAEFYEQMGQKEIMKKITQGSLRYLQRIC